MKISALFLLFGLLHCAFGQTNTNALVAGDWSAPVADKGQTLRGRLWVGEGHYLSDPLPRASRGRAERYWDHAPVYLELEHVVTFGWDQPIQIYFDLFSSLQFEMHDGFGKSIRPHLVSFGAEVPEPIWVTLPCDAMVRLRADIYNVGNSTNIGDHILVGDGGKGPAAWVIPPNSTSDYFLSCTFCPSTNQLYRYHPSPLPLRYHVWQGTLKIPKVKVPVKKPAQPGR